MVLKPMVVTNLNTRHLPEVGRTASDRIGAPLRSKAWNEHIESTVPQIAT
jgi:hypothetical protein